jgi:Skp family chaperone for outer membrane proteins
MKVTKVSWLVVAALAVGVLLWRDSLGQAPAPAPVVPQGSLAVMDVEEVLLNYQHANDLRNDLEKRRQALDLEDRKRKEAIDRDEAQLPGLTEGSPEYVNKVNEMRRLAIDRDGFIKFEMQLLQAEHHRRLEALYDEVVKMATAVAKENGYKVVLYADHKMPKTRDSTELTAVLKDRKVVCNDPSVDITELVLKRLNDASRTPTTRP